MDVSDITININIYNKDRGKKRSTAAPTHRYAEVNIESFLIGTPSEVDIFQALIEDGINVGKSPENITETTSSSIELKPTKVYKPSEPVGLTNYTASDILKELNIMDDSNVSGLEDLDILGEPVVDAVNNFTPIFITADLCRGNDKLVINPLFTLNTNAAELIISVYGLTDGAKNKTHLIVNQKTNDVLLKIDDTRTFSAEQNGSNTFFVYVNRTTSDDYGIVPVTLTNSSLCDSYKKNQPTMIQTETLQVEVPYVVQCVEEKSTDRFKRELQYRALSVFSTDSNIERVTVLNFRDDEDLDSDCKLRVIDLQVIYFDRVTYKHGNILEFIKQGATLVETHMNSAWKQTDASGNPRPLMRAKKILFPMSNGDVEYSKYSTSVVGVAACVIVGVSVYFVFQFGVVITATHLIYWRQGGSLVQRSKILRKALLFPTHILSIMIQSLSFVDYSNMKGVTNPSNEIKIALGVLVILNVLTLTVKMYLFIRHCILDKQFYDKYGLINPLDEPTSLFQLRTILPLILHDNIFKCVNYFYVIRYRPVHLTMSIYTFVLMPLEFAFSFIPLAYSLIDRTRDKNVYYIYIVIIVILTHLIYSCYKKTQKSEMHFNIFTFFSLIENIKKYFQIELNTRKYETTKYTYSAYH